LKQLLEATASRFQSAGIEQYQADAELLLSHLLGCSRGELASKVILGQALTQDQLTAFEAMVSRRESREPLQHITGVAYFRNLELKVGRGVFVPRPETELIAQLAIDALRASASPNLLAADLGTGSGAIALAMASEVPNATVYGVEKSEDALPFTQANFQRWAENNGVLIHGDLADAFETSELSQLHSKFSVVASNPPYIPNDAIPRDLEVRLHDPSMALYGGDDGMDVIHAVSATAKKLLHDGGFLVIEHADNQSQQVCQLLLQDGWRQVRAHRDLTLRDRAVTALK
jgi:release factor glutamine methyltransferase